VLAWYMADAKDLTRFDADHHGTDNGVARTTALMFASYARLCGVATVDVFAQDV
jgi:hypothetical protein